MSVYWLLGSGESVGVGAGGTAVGVAGVIVAGGGVGVARGGVGLEVGGTGAGWHAVIRNTMRKAAAADRTIPGSVP